MTTQTPEQSIVSQETQWTQTGTREQSQVDATHLMCSTGTIASIPCSHSVKSSSRKSKPIKCGDLMHSVMIAIEYMIQLNLNSMFPCTVPAFKLHVLHAHNHEHVFFANLHANKNPSNVTHECTVQAHVSLGTRYTLANTSDTQVEKLHAGKKTYMQACSRLSTGASWYLRDINHRIMGLSIRYNSSCVLLASSLFLKRTCHHESGY